MSTEYVLHKSGPKLLALGEYSGVLDLYYWDQQGHTSTIFRHLSPEQVLDIAIKMIHAASYQVADADGFLKDAARRAGSYQ